MTIKSLTKLISTDDNFFFLISDPDLTINVDLGREEEEKNGRRKYNVHQMKTSQN